MQDEPTNHLDLPSILWLQGYLKTLEDRTIVVVSHDRAFLDKVAQEIILLRHNRLAYHTGKPSHCCSVPLVFALGSMKSFSLLSVVPSIVELAFGNPHCCHWTGTGCAQETTASTRGMRRRSSSTCSAYRTA